ncbi:MAG: hypothetical protein ACRD08_06955, partial [Acidimicrobiales bacterium]
MSTPLPPAQHGAVLAGIKATPSGWPPASLDPDRGRTPNSSDRERQRKNDSDKIRSLRFQGIAADPASGAVLDVGRERYLPPPELAEHVIARDRSCRFPTCTRSAEDSD